MTTILRFTPEVAFSSGVFAPGAKAYFYKTGTTEPVIVYTDADYSTAHASPVVADAAGVFPQVFYGGGDVVKAVIAGFDDTAIATLDPVDKVNVAGSGADSITFSPIVGNNATTVAGAIGNNTDAREDRASEVKTFLASADTAEMRTNLALGTAATVDVVDEDDMATDSATRPASQQSVKAYVDAQVNAIFLTPVGAAVVSDGALVTVDAQQGGAISRTGTGAYTFTFTEELASTNYILSGSVLANNRKIEVVSKSTTAVTFQVEVSGSGTAEDNPFDIMIWSL